MNILGKKVVLRAIEERDLEPLHRWANDSELGAMLGGWHFPTSMEDQRRWFASLQQEPLNQRFAIEAGELGLVGTANLVEIDWKNNHAFTGMMLGSPETRGKGIGVDAIHAVMRYAFDELHLERLDASIIDYNTASMKAYCDKCGWVVEGRQRSWYFRKAKYWDRVLVGITRADYRDLLARTRYWETP